MAMFLLRGLRPGPCARGSVTSNKYVFCALCFDPVIGCSAQIQSATVKCDNMLHCMLFAGVRERVKAREEREIEREREIGRKREREREGERGERRETRCRESFVTPKSFVATRQPNSLSPPEVFFIWGYW